MAKSKFAIGALFGAIVGGVAALLTAPKSGKETRADLIKKADEVKKTAEGKVNEIKKTAEEKATEVKEKAEVVKTDLETQAKDLRDRAEGAIQGAKDGFNKKDAK